MTEYKGWKLDYSHPHEVWIAEHPTGMRLHHATIGGIMGKVDGQPKYGDVLPTDTESDIERDLRS